VQKNKNKEVFIIRKNCGLELIEKHLGADEARKYDHSNKTDMQVIEERYGADIARHFRKFDNVGATKSANFAELGTGQTEQDPHIKSRFGETIAEILQEYEKKVALETAVSEKPFSSYTGSTGRENPIVIEMKKKYMSDLGKLIESIGTALLEKNAEANKSAEYSRKKALTDAIHIVDDMSSKLWKIHYKMQYGINF